MDESTLPQDVEKTVWWITQFWPFLAVGLAVYAGGAGAKHIARRLVPDSVPEAQQPLWYKVWSSTIRWHPVAVGAAAGLLPGMPIPAWVPDSWVAKVFWFGLAGAVSGHLYSALKELPGTFKTVLSAVVQQRLGVRLPTPAPSTPSKDDPASVEVEIPEEKSDEKDVSADPGAIPKE